MNITGSTPPANDSAASQAASPSEQPMGKQDFLRLLVTQLSNQDPLNPMEGQDFAVQLAQFSSVEQLTNISGLLEGQDQQGSRLSQALNQGMAAGMLGQTVTADSQQVSWQGSGSVPLQFSLDGPAEQVNLTLTNDKGEVAYTRDLGSFTAGDQQIRWNGTDDAGTTLPAGDYTFEVSAADSDGKAVPVSTQLYGEVDRVSFTGDGVHLQIGGARVPLGSVSSVASPE